MALCVAIKEFNERLLSLDDLSTLHVLIPTIQEREILLGYSRNKKKIDGKPLAPAESFLLQMCKEPDIDMMLNAFKFKCMFNNELNDIESICERITKICLLIKQGMKFKILLSIFITFKDTTNEIFSNGNNGFKPWMGKDARQLGLKISNLSKIKDIKSNDNEWSLMIYLIDLIKKQGNDVFKY